MPKIRVLVVDDAAVMRRLVSDVLGRDPQIEVVGTAPNGMIALQRIPQVNPDIVTLDVEMPEMDGVSTVIEIRKTYRRLPIIMFSALTQRGAASTLDALSAGANDYVAKAGNVSSLLEGIARLEKELIPRIKALCPQSFAISPKVPVAEAATVALPSRPAVSKPSVSGNPPGVVCVGASTGGPTALTTLISGFAESLRVPVVMVQHMPPIFTKTLADRLAKASPMPCHEAEDRQLIEPGHIYMAPGGHHMEIVREGGVIRARLHDGPPENSCRPAVDVLFRSVVATYGSPMPALSRLYVSKEPAASGKQRLSRTYWMPLALVASKSR
jgi:two-component system chemotaxis response regulator CheB